MKKNIPNESTCSLISHFDIGFQPNFLGERKCWCKLQPEIEFWAEYWFVWVTHTHSHAHNLVSKQLAVMNIQFVTNRSDITSHCHCQYGFNVCEHSILSCLSFTFFPHTHYTYAESKSHSSVLIIFMTVNSHDAFVHHQIRSHNTSLLYSIHFPKNKRTKKKICDKRNFHRIAFSCFVICCYLNPFRWWSLRETVQFIIQIVSSFCLLLVWSSVKWNTHWGLKSSE